MKAPPADQWFSARVRLVVMTDRDGWLHYADSVVLVRADDFPSACARAIEAGKLMEESFLNEAGARVSWRLKEVLTLDRIKASNLDGAEVFFETVDVPDSEKGTPDAQLRPEHSEPRETF